MTTTSQLKQILIVGLACAAFVVVVNAVRFFRATSLQNNSVLVAEDSPNKFPVQPVDAELPERDQPGRLPHANRIPAVDRSTERFPVQPATLDSIPWNSQVESVNRIPVELDSHETSSSVQNETQSGVPLGVVRNLQPANSAVASNSNQPSKTLNSPSDQNNIRIAGLTADGVALKPYKPPAKPPTAEFAIVKQSETRPRNQLNLTEENQFPMASETKQATANPIINPYAVDSSATGGVYPLTDTLAEDGQDNSVSSKSVKSGQTTVVKNRFFPEVDNQLAKTEPNTINEIPMSAGDTDPDLTSLPAMESNFSNSDFIPPIQTQLAPSLPPTAEDRSNENDFVPSAPRVAKANSYPKTKTPEPPAPPTKDDSPSVLRGAENFVLAEQPQQGEHWKDDRPTTDQRAWLIDPIKDDFSPDPIDPLQPYDPYQQMNVYEGKTLNSNQRPILELGRPWYQLGQLSPGYSWFGKHNNITPQLLVYGDVRTAVASNTQNGDNVSQIAFEANLDFDLKLTGTERFHMFMSPLDDGRNTRWLLDDDEFVDETDADIDFGYFEGDLGAMVGGFTNKTLPFDMPFAVGVMPLLLQNGVWFEDAFLGVATTIPARSSAKFNISNMDTTFFAGYDKINSDAFIGDDSAARMYGVASFIEAMNGYFEIDYAFLDDRTFNDRSYHNFGFAFTRRFGRLLSNSTRVIVNAGQSTDVVENSADGVLLLSENSLITSSPSTLVPYMNFFAGFDRPQSAARAAAAGGVLRNTGILFESDGMTNYPTLDATANDTYGGALGINLIADDFSQQLVVEMAMLGVMGEDVNRNAADSQYGLGFRYQLPLTNAIIFRADGMYGFLEDDHDVRGLRFELRHKY